jgi:hypothetical protein
MNIINLTQQQLDLLETGHRIESKDGEKIYLHFPFWVRPLKNQEKNDDTIKCEVLTRGQIPNVTQDYKQGGLQANKYIIKKTNGSSVDPEAFYFVLRIDTDIHAQAAAMEYAKSVRYQDPELAIGLMDTVMSYSKEKLDTSEFWSKYYPYKIMDPDGWDRSNYHYSWNEERITWETFKYRATQSTSIFATDE